MLGSLLPSVTGRLYFYFHFILAACLSSVRFICSQPLHHIIDSAVTMASRVALSEDTKAAALNLTAKAYELRHTIAAVWDLPPGSSVPPSPESAEALNATNPGEESVVGQDGRKLVPDVHFSPGGKYRCTHLCRGMTSYHLLTSSTAIVKLFMRYEFSEPGKYYIGTGWLVRPDVLVTAGHCSYMSLTFLLFVSVEAEGHNFAIGAVYFSRESVPKAN